MIIKASLRIIIAIIRLTGWKYPSYEMKIPIPWGETIRSAGWNCLFHGMKRIVPRQGTTCFTVRNRPFPGRKQTPSRKDVSLNKQCGIKRQIMPGTAISRRWIDLRSGHRQFHRQQATELRQLLAVQRAYGYCRRRFLHMLHHIHFVVNGGTARIFTGFLRRVVRLLTFRTTGRAATLLHPASRTAIMDNGNSRPTYDNKWGYQYGEYVTEPLHRRRQR